ncbi:MAG: trigger factor [Campylobacterales bacterium]|nr:trigger factor [Campylobacterales bacterium]
MELKTNRIDGANAEITATLAKADIDANLERLAKQLSKDAKIDGFRKGKVPVSAVKKQYGERLVQDAEAEELRKALDLGLKDLGTASDALIGEPQIVKFEKSDDKIDVEIKIAMRPEIKIDGYADLVPDVKKPNITAKAVTDRIQELAQSQATLVDVEEERALVEGDAALINFEGSVDGVLFEGGAAENFSLTLGSKQFIPGFEEQVIGMKKGEEKIIKVTFPENYGGKELAGKDADFKVKVNAIQEKEKVRLDAALAKKMLPGEEDASMDMLKEKVQEQLENEALSKLYNDELKPALLEKFVETFNFDLPAFVVEQEMDMALNKKAQTMNEEEISELRENAEKVQTLREEFREDATRSVKATFIIDALAKAENIKVEENEVMQTIYFEAIQMGQDPAGVYDNYKKSGYLPAIQMAMVEDKVLTKLIDAKLKD